jgi:hypothetical protein
MKNALLATLKALLYGLLATILVLHTLAWAIVAIAILSFGLYPYLLFWTCGFGIGSCVLIFMIWVITDMIIKE